MDAGAVAFEKWEGLGNDFILVEASALPDSVPDALIRRLCDRHRGVGADGVLVIAREGQGSRMIVRNADGSRPEMCGNGIRCVAGYLAAREGAEQMVIETDAGPRPCRTQRNDAGELIVAVDMGAARFAEDLVVEIEGVRKSFLHVDMGNPHAITFEEMTPAAFDRAARIVENALPGGTNVELVRVGGDELEVVVWERGVGYTEACGTGACAVAAAACASKRAPMGAPVRVRLPGGTLTLRVGEGFAVEMTGPASRVFAGTYLL